MKNAVLYLLAPLFFLLSCRQEDEVTRLLFQAENCMESHPDSALRILRQLATPEKLQGSQQADYALLMTQAMHKNNLALTSDSLITVALHYYQHSDNTLRKGQSNYYMGAVCEEEEDLDAAFGYYLHAIEALQGNENFKMLGLVNTSIGRICYEKGLYQKSTTHQKQAISFFLRVYDSLSVSISARTIGHNYLLLNKLDSADFYLDEAYRFATTDERRIEVQGDKQIVYREQGAYQKSADVFLKVLNLSGRSAEERACSYLTLGKFYLKQKKVAKAQDCFLKSIEMGNLDTRAACFSSLYRMKKKEGNYAEALEYHESLFVLFDSIVRIQNEKEVVALQLKYDKEKVEQELSLKYVQLWLSFSLLSLLVLLLLFLWRCYLAYRKRKESELVCMEMRIAKAQAEICDYENRLVVTEEQLDQSRQNRDVLLNEKKYIEDVLRQKEEVAVKLMVEKKQMTSTVLLLSKSNKTVLGEDCRLIEAFHLYESLVTCPKKSSCHTSDDWELLFRWTDITYRNFYTRLKQSYSSLKRRDLQICCLLKLGFSNEDMRMIFDVQQRTLYTDKSQTKRRLGLNEGDKIEKWLFLF